MEATSFKLRQPHGMLYSTAVGWKKESISQASAARMRVISGGKSMTKQLRGPISTSCTRRRSRGWINRRTFGKLRKRELGLGIRFSRSRNCWQAKSQVAQARVK